MVRNGAEGRKRAASHRQRAVAGAIDRRASARNRARPFRRPPGPVCRARRWHPSHVTAGQLKQFQALRPAVVDAAAALVQSPLPATLNHGDLHPGNVLTVDGHLRPFDFGDTQWAAAPRSSGHLWGGARPPDPRHPWRTVFAAYAEVWSDVVTRAEFDHLVAAAMVTLPVNRSLTWWSATRQTTTEELAQWGGGAAFTVELCPPALA